MIFTEDEVKSLNEYQKEGLTHPFTCGNNHDGERVLVATTDGWICPSCDYKQDWAHSWMANWKWREAVESIREKFGKAKQQ